MVKSMVDEEMEVKIALRLDGELKIPQLMDTFLQVVASEMGSKVQLSEESESEEGDDVGVGEVVGVEVGVEIDMIESGRDGTWVGC